MYEEKNLEDKLNQESTLSSISHLLSKLIEDAEPLLQKCIKDSPDELKIVMPTWLYQYTYENRQELANKALGELQGIPIEKGYENAVVLYHKDCTVHNSDWMIHRLQLAPGVPIEGKQGALSYSFDVVLPDHLKGGETVN